MSGRRIPEGLEQWLSEKTVVIGRAIKKLNCYEQRQRKLKKLQIDIERTTRYMRDKAVMPYSLYVEKLNRVSELQARHMIITGHYYKVMDVNVIRDINDKGVI